MYKLRKNIQIKFEDKNQLFEELCNVIEDYNNDKCSEMELYKMLIKLQNNWSKIVS